MEPMPDTYPSLFWGYTVIWTIFACYIYSLIRRVAKLEKMSEKNQSPEDNE